MTTPRTTRFFLFSFLEGASMLLGLKKAYAQCIGLSVLRKIWG
jgi:hypothetical protein